jgi:hypothetical protein
MDLAHIATSEREREREGAAAAVYDNTFGNHLIDSTLSQTVFGGNAWIGNCHHNNNNNTANRLSDSSNSIGNPKQ